MNADPFIEGTTEVSTTISPIVDEQSAIDAMAERAVLLRILATYCRCQEDAGELTEICPSHQALADPMFVRRMCFVRSLSARLVGEEFAETGATIELEPEPRMISEFTYRVLQAMDAA